MANRDSARKVVLVEVGNLVPGMELADDLMSGDGTILASAGTVISSYTIEKIKNWQVDTLNIFSEAKQNPLAGRHLEQFVNSYNRSVSAVARAFDSMRDGQDVPVAAFSATAAELTAGVRTAGNVVDLLYDLPPCDEATFRHSVNVGIISALIATWLGYPPELVNAVSLSGLLHDVGKSLLPPSLLHYPSRLSPEDYAHYQQHVRYGYELVKNLPDLASSVKAGVGQHHERNDRSGYPLGLAGDKIHLYAKIVAVADTFDEALTLNHDPGTVYSPYSGVEKVNDEKHRADAQVSLVFIGHMLNYLSGNMVALTDGREGLVVYLNPDQPSRSMVQLTSGAIIDLADDPVLRIHHVIR